MSYFAANPSGNLLEKIGDSLRDSIPKLGKKIIRVVIEYIKDDIRIHSKVAKPKILIACDEVGKSKDEQEVVQLLLYSLIDNDDDLECFFTGLSLDPFLEEISSGRGIQYVPLPLLSFNSSLGLVKSFVAGSQFLPVLLVYPVVTHEPFKFSRLLLKMRVGKKCNGTTIWSKPS